MGSEVSATKKINLVEVASGFLLVVLFSLTLKTLDFLFMPLCLALLLCYAFGIPLDFLERLHVPSWLRIVLTVLIVLAVFYLLGRLVVYNAMAFEARLPEFEEKFWRYANNSLSFFNITQQEAKEVIDAFWGNLSKTGLKPVGTVVQKVGQSFFDILGNTIWVLLFMLFILAEKGSFTRRVVKSFGEDRAENILTTTARINKSVQQYLGLKTLVSFITGALVAMALWLLGVPFALLWGVLAFMLNYIPNIGSLVASIPPIAIALFQFGSIGKTLVVAAVITIIQFCVANFLEPKLMGRGLNLSPLVVLLALVFWGWMWGVIGMLLSVPLTAALKIALEEVEVTRPIAMLISGE